MTRRGGRGRVACAIAGTRRAGRRRMRTESRCSRVGGRAIHRARYYNPYLCRFLNSDPSGFKGGLNFYSYAAGNPVSYLDASGLNAMATGDTSFNWLGFGGTPADLSNPFNLPTEQPDWFDKTLDVANNIYQTMYPPPEVEAQRSQWQQAIDQFGQFVAAVGMPEFGGSEVALTKTAEQTLAETQSGYLLGTVEDGQVSLFGATEQIAGHSDLLSQGLISPTAQGFSIVIENGQVTVMRTFSSLNSEALNFNLPGATINQLQNIFRVPTEGLFVNP